MKQQYSSPFFDITRGFRLHYIPFHQSSIGEPPGRHMSLHPPHLLSPATWCCQHPQTSSWPLGNPETEMAIEMGKTSPMKVGKRNENPI